MTKSIRDIVEEGRGTIYRYRDYYGGARLEEAELVWHVQYNPMSKSWTLYHYNRPLINWDNINYWYTHYSMSHDLTRSDVNGINTVVNVVNERRREARKNNPGSLEEDL